MQHYDHLAVARLEDGMFDVVVKDVHLVSAYGCEPEP